jgi:iron complex outermembrane receptor protein
MLCATKMSLALLVVCSSAAFADDVTPPVVGGKTYVQHQILGAKRLHPEIISITVVGKRPEDKAPVALGSTASARDVFKPAPELADGSTVAGRYFIVSEPFLSSTGHRLGTIEIRFRNLPSKVAQYTNVAREIQARMARDTLSLKNAIDPYPFDPAFGPNTYAQQLTKRTVAAHPDLLVMMIHATPPKGAHNVIIGSNICRFGKQADEDDLRVIEKGSTNLEVGGDKDRYETELPLLDRAGRRIGALGLVFALKPDTDKEALHRHGLAIRDEVARAIPNNAALFRRSR